MLWNYLYINLAITLFFLYRCLCDSDLDDVKYEVLIVMLLGLPMFIYANTVYDPEDWI